jgi:hypothetical protein
MQLHYDLRHSVDPKINDRNFLFLNFNYYKELDSLRSGNFLFQVQSQLDGKKSNISQTFIQMSTNVKFWTPKVYLSLYFSGGLGVSASSFGYYIANAYGLGISYPLIFAKTWFNFGLLYRYSATVKPSSDPQFNFYIGGGLFNYKLMYGGSIVFWAPDKDNGLPENLGRRGKKLCFFGDPQLWYGIGKDYSVGTKVSISYYAINDENRIMFYPTVGLKRKF